MSTTAALDFSSWTDDDIESGIIRADVYAGSYLMSDRMREATLTQLAALKRERTRRWIYAYSA